MKVKGLGMILKSESFVEVLLDAQLTQSEATELGVNVNAILNLVYDPSGKCIIVAILEGTEMIEISLSEQEIQHVNEFIRDNKIYDEIMGMLTANVG
jgi:hypothetical protein